MAKDNQEKYGNIEAMLADDDDQKTDGKAPVKTRARRPSPALSAMSGDKRPTSVTDNLKAEKKAAEDKLADATEKFEKEKEKLLRQLAKAKEQGADKPIILTMPVTKQEVTFELKRIDPSLIDVSPENERIQDFLDEISLQDILPSIRKHGQQKPGTLRPKEGGRFELIEGSRRLASVKLAGKEYLGLVGDVPDADVRELGIIENKHQDVSPYEKAIAFLRQIDAGEYENWTQLGAAKGISNTHILRFKACVELDKLYVRILPSPSDMPISYGETIAKLMKKGEGALKKKAKELLKQREGALKNNTELPDAEGIIKILKSAVRTKAEAPKSWKPVFYTSGDGRCSVKHSVTNKGSTKFEIDGASEEMINKVLEGIQSTLKVKKSD